MVKKATVPLTKTEVRKNPSSTSAGVTSKAKLEESKTSISKPSSRKLSA
jgi:hypothetical protein